MILPFISYCIHAWGKAANIHLDKIHKLQKKIVRIISGVPPRSHTLPLFKKLRIMTIYQNYEYYIGVFMYKLFHNKFPPLFEMFERTANIHNYSTRQINCYYIHHVPTVRSQKTIKITGSKLWNIISNNINISCKISSYKINLKKFLLSCTDRLLE